MIPEENESLPPSLERAESDALTQEQRSMSATEAAEIDADPPIGGGRDPRTLTEGEWRVGVDFNPGGDQVVDSIKRISANLIDLVLNAGGDPRCAAEAATLFEDGAMWAVKSVTKPEPVHRQNRQTFVRGATPQRPQP